MKPSNKQGALAISVAALLALAGFEGFSDKAYQPLPGDKWTYGFGHTAGVEKGDEIDLYGAVRLLKEDVKVFERAVNRAVTVPVTQSQFDALVMFTYNVGVYAFQKSTLLRCLNDKNYACVDREWVRWKFFHGKPVKGLEARRARELAIFHGEPIIEKDGRICFGSAGCLGIGDLLQERSRGPDGAQTDRGGSGGGVVHDALSTSPKGGKGA